MDFGYCEEIHTEQKPVEYSRWLTNAKGILEGAKEGLLSGNYIERKEIDEVLNALEGRIKKPEGVFLFHWNRIKVKKSN